MADNITLNRGAGGATVKTDEIGGVQTPVGKILLGADGVDDGYVSEANALPTNPGASSADTDSIETRDPLSWAGSNGTAITTATTTEMVAAPAAGNHLVPVVVLFTSKGATTVKVALRHGASGPLRHEVVLGQGDSARFYLGHSWAAPSATSLCCHTDATGEVYWTLGYKTEIDA